MTRTLVQHPSPNNTHPPSPHPHRALGHSGVDLTGQRFGKLTVIKRECSTLVLGAWIWLCKCDCGRQVVAPTNRLRAKRVWHCGCMGHGRHSMSGTKVHRAWQSMKERCYNPNHSDFHNYGQRGIVVCDKWRTDFLSFYEHIGDPPSERHSVDRIDMNGNYEPGNVRWATPKEQARNQRNNRLLTYKGERHCLNEWAEILSVKPITLYHRIRNGWTVERAFETPVEPRYRTGAQCPDEISDFLDDL